MSNSHEAISFGQAVRKALVFLDQQDIDTSVNAAVASTTDPFALGDTTELVFHFSKQYIAPAQYTKHTPAWANGQDVLTEIATLQSPGFWRNNLTAINNKEPKAIKDLLLAAPPLYGTIDHASRAIAHANTNFYGAGLMCAAIAALIGREYPTVFTKKIYTDKKENKFALTSYMTGKDFAGYFHAPAASFDEYYARLQALFPHDPQQADTSLYRSLIEHGAFEREYTRYELIGVRKIEKKQCPETHLTDMIFQSYGRILQTAAYKDALQSRIQLTY